MLAQGVEIAGVAVGNGSIAASEAVLSGVRRAAYPAKEVWFSVADGIHGYMNPASSKTARLNRYAGSFEHGVSHQPAIASI